MKFSRKMKWFHSCTGSSSVMGCSLMGCFGGRSLTVIMLWIILPRSLTAVTVTPSSPRGVPNSWYRKSCKCGANSMIT